VVDAQPRDHGRQPRFLGLDRVAGLVQAQVRVLDEVLGLAEASHHPIGDRQHQRAQVFGCHRPPARLVSIEHSMKETS
jgi:hypothetical protein